MKNDYLNSKAVLYKKQNLTTEYKRVINHPFSSSIINISFEWQKAMFEQQQKNNNKPPIEWNFVKGLQFDYAKVLQADIYKQNEINSKSSFSADPFAEFKKLPSLPATNLMYLCSWDIIMFEEFQRLFILNLIESQKQIGEVIEISSFKNMNAHLNFKGCIPEKSVFKNDLLYGKLIGYTSYQDQDALIIEFRSSGRLHIVSKTRNRIQEGESFYIGKLILDFNTYDLLSADMIEILYVSTKLIKSNKKLQQNKRRFVTLNLITKDE